MEFNKEELEMILYAIAKMDREDNYEEYKKLFKKIIEDIGNNK